jgi:cellulose synthase/poly-beta-1,6-N-acetylglucosamine synthase-like glycosyltransferase
LVITPLASSLFILVEEFNVLGEWYKPIMLSSFSIVYLTNFMAVPLAVASKHREKQITASMPYIVPLTVIIPAYNEEKWIGHCIEAVLEADYPSKEVIVVDDGSTDNTYEVASRYASRGVTVLRKPNGGKASALNYGLLFATGEVVVCIDADSIIGRETLKNIVKPFMDPHVVGVAGNVKVVNQVNWLTKNQALEYLTQLNIIRRATSFFGAVQVMPGPLAAFRRQQAIQVGRYDRETLTEDFDITVKLQKAGGVIQAPSNAYAYTEAPSKLSSLYRQRLRWYRGNTQVLLRHKDVPLKPKVWIPKLPNLPTSCYTADRRTHFRGFGYTCRCHDNSGWGRGVCNLSSAGFLTPANDAFLHGFSIGWGGCASCYLRPLRGCWLQASSRHFCGQSCIRHTCSAAQAKVDKG